MVKAPSVYYNKRAIKNFMSALNRTNNRYRVAIEFESIVEARAQDARSRSCRDPIFAVYLTSLFVVGRCLSARGPILSLPQAIMTNQVFFAGELQLQIRFVLRIEILKIL